MGRWFMFFVAAFIICGFFVSITEYNSTTGYNGPDMLGVTVLRADMTASTTPGQIVTVTSTTDFPGPSGYFVAGAETCNYTTKDATHFNGVSRGVMDPTVINKPSKVIAHSSGVKIMTLRAAVINSSMGGVVMTTEGTSGEFSAMTYVKDLMLHFPKYLTWNFPCFESHAGYLVKLILLTPISAGFAITFAIALVQLVQGIFKI